VSEAPRVIPLFPRRAAAEEAANWREVFAFIGAHPPLDWRDDSAARALLAAAHAYLEPTLRSQRGA
jgi:hypothetical protein